MALFDQYYDTYEQVGHISPMASVETMSEPLPLSGYISARLDIDELPIFQLSKVNYNPSAAVVQMVVSNNIVVLSLKNNHVVRIDLDNPADVDEIEISRRSADAIGHIFLDPHGRHLIVSTHSGENYYLHGLSNKPKPLGKLKGHMITSVAFNRAYGTPSSTKAILIGTSRGVVLECEIEPSEAGFFAGKEERYVKQVFNAGDDQPIIGLRFDQFPAAQAALQKYFVVAATLSRLYQFIGTKATEAPIFAPLFANPWMEEVGMPYDKSQLQFFAKHQSLPFVAAPRSYAWTTQLGLQHGEMQYGAQGSGDQVTAATEMEPYPHGEHPLAMILTEFHALLLNQASLVAVCTLDGFIACDVPLPEPMAGLCTDGLRNTVWAWGSYSIYEVTVHEEARNVWRVYLDRGMFDTALQYCKGHAENADKVLVRQAEHYMGLGRYALAADYYARTSASFEEVALLFLDLGQSDAVRIYLTRKLHALRPQDKAQITMLAMWLVEIWLTQMDQCEEAGDKEGFQTLQQELRAFLTEPKVKDQLSVQQAAVFDLLYSHGRIDEALYFAGVSGDISRIVRYYISQKEYDKALAILSEHHSTHLFELHSPELLIHDPKATVDAWIKEPALDPRRLISALTKYQSTYSNLKPEEHEGIRYLEHCITAGHASDTAIHNYLLSLYVDTNAGDRLERFVNQSTHYDRQYALRLCTQRRKLSACVYIYEQLGLLDEAVECALKVDVDRAKEVAARAPDDMVRRKLWLTIARHVVEHDGDVEGAMQLIRESQVLRIEDILPFFPDFTRIDLFKDAICASLTAYNEHIEELKQKMREATQSANMIRKDIQAMRSKYGVILGTDKCFICKAYVLTREFYYFPCTHVFHTDCLHNQVFQQLPAALQKRVQDMEQTLASGRAADAERIRDEIDDIIAGECVLCGSAMIKTIDEPFSVDQSDWAL